MDKKEIARDFASWMRDLGAVGSVGEATMDGRWHRVRLAGDKPNEMTGSYKGFLDGQCNGILHAFRTGETYKWIARGVSKGVPGDEGRSAGVREGAAKKSTLEELLDEQYDAAARRAFGIWVNSLPVDASEAAYLRGKRVGAYGIKRTEDRKLVVPGIDIGGRLRTLQFIDETGGKRFLAHSQKNGSFHMIASAERFLGDVIVMAEGYATTATVHELTGMTTVAAFDAGNLLSVGKAIAYKYPSKGILIAADNDRNLAVNVGLKSAQKAAAAVGGIVVYPSFGSHRQGTDFNDLVRVLGHEKVANLFNKAVRQNFNREASRDRGMSP